MSNNMKFAIVSNKVMAPVFYTIEKALGVLTWHNMTYGYTIELVDSFATTFFNQWWLGLIKTIKNATTIYKDQPLSAVMEAYFQYFTGTLTEQLYSEVIKHGDIDALEELLARKVTNNQKLLSDILRTEHDSTARYMIQHGFANFQGINFTTVLCYSSNNKTPNILKLALEHGADVNHKCWDRVTPLENAVVANNLENVKAIFEYSPIVPPNILIKCSYEDEQLESGITQYIIFKEKIDIDYKIGNTSLFLRSVAGGQYKLANYLLDNYKIDINFGDEYWKPIMHAVSYCKYINSDFNRCNPDIIAKLLDKGSDARIAGGGLNLLDHSVKASPNLAEQAKHIIYTIICNGNYTKDEISNSLRFEMSEEIRSLLLHFSENNYYCPSYDLNEYGNLTCSVETNLIGIVNG